MNTKTKILLSTLGAAAALGGSALAFSEKLKTVTYTLQTDKVSSPVRLCLLTDLHSSYYGKKQCKLIRTVKNLNPDLVMMSGDMVDNRIINDFAYVLCEALTRRFPCFFVSGNHEFYNSNDREIKKRLTECGVTVLEGERVDVMVNTDILSIVGIDDPYIPQDDKGRIWEEQFGDISTLTDGEHFSILLSHRPEIVDFYRETDFDLILTGHAHGGQVIIPHILNGLYSPHQGLFPKYAGGSYLLKKNQRMIVSRGLSKYNRPRVFNRPEVVIIDLIP